MNESVQVQSVNTYTIKEKNHYKATHMKRPTTPLMFAAIFMLQTAYTSGAYTKLCSYTWRNECAGYYQLALPG